MKEFTVDKYRKSQAIKDMKLKIKGSDRVLYIFSILLRGISVAIAVLGFRAFLTAELNNFMQICVLNLVIVSSSAVWVISALIKTSIEDVYIYPLNSSSEETLFLTDDWLIYKKYDDSIADELTAYRIIYGDIREIQYDKSKCCLLIRGKIKVANSFDADDCMHYEVYDKYCEDVLVPAYFNNFDDIIKILKDKSGIDIKMCQIKV